MSEMTRRGLIGSVNGVTVQTHDSLAKATEDEFRQNPAKVLHDAAQGIQTAIVAADGRVKAVVGLSGIRFLSDPDPDPLAEWLVERGW